MEYIELNAEADIIGLYTDEPGYPAPPAGSVPVPVAVGELLRTQGFAGKRWIDGALADAPPPPPPPKATLVAAVLAKARAMRLPIMSVLDGLQASALTNGNTAQAQAIEAGKQALRDITALDLAQFETKEQMEAAVFMAYVSIRNAAPAVVQSAFQSLVP